MRLNGRIAVVTGATGSIGRAICQQFAREGASVVVVGRDQARLDAVLAGLDTTAPALAVVADLSTIGDIDKVVASAVDGFGRIDILVNSAGWTRRASLYEITEDDWDRMERINLKGLFFCVQRAAAVMKLQRSGVIINMGGPAAKGYAWASNAAYAATKGGVVTLTRVASHWLAQDGIRINAICPSYTDTDMLRKAAEARAAQTKQTTDEVVQEFARRAPLGRLATVDDVANMATFLASDEASFVTGAAISVDGGLFPV